MHYYDFIDTNDKIIHLLCAAYMEGIYGRTIIECIKEFGEKETEKAVLEFKQSIKNNLKRRG